MTNLEILTRLGACASGIARARESATLREWWETSTTRGDMMWLIGRAHTGGAMPRRRLVAVAVRCAETVAHLMPTDALPLLADLNVWAQGAYDVDLAAVRDRLWEIRRAAAADAADAADAYAADAADAAAAAAAAAAVAAAVADAAAAAVAADAAAAAAAYAADAAAVCDVIRDAITIDEICAALGLDPDQGV